MECFYCHAKGHIKADCRQWKKDRERSVRAKPVGLVKTGHVGLSHQSGHTRICVKGSSNLVGRSCGKRVADAGVCSGSVDATGRDQEGHCENVFPGLDTYKGFVSKGQVSDVSGKGDAKSVVILRDTGAAQSLMLSDVAP